MDYDKAFFSLSDTEFSIVYWKCQGLTHDQIVLLFRNFNQYYSRAWVQEHKSDADKKLGISHLQSTDREKVYEKEICPALQEWIKHHEEVLNRLRPPRGTQLPPGEDTGETITGVVVDDIPGQGGQQRINRTAVTRLLIVLGIIVGLWFVFFRPQSQPPATPTQNIEPSATHNETISPTATIESTSTPEIELTPTIPPTAVPLPIREDFSKQYSDLWYVSGDPLVTENVQGGNLNYSGVLTTGSSNTATLLIGNTAWHDYVVSLGAYYYSLGWTNGLEPIVLIGVRVQDLNNMIGLECKFNNACVWIVIHDGLQDRLPSGAELVIDRLITITVQGDTFTAVAQKYAYAEDETLSFVLPPKYKGKYDGGGVLLKLKDRVQVNFFEINVLP